MNAPIIVQNNNIVDVWLDAYELLVSNGNKYNLILHVTNPLHYERDTILNYDPHAIDTSNNVRNVLDVANTIFPSQSVRWDLPVIDFTQYYIEAYDRLLSRGKRGWGCYFLRLVSFGENKINQLERVINGLANWGYGHKAAFVVHFSASTLDKPRPLGGPCLQYIQFTVDKSHSLSMTAVYRSHDYFYKALGNLLGLSRILEYVANKTGHKTGNMTCVSTYAFIKTKKAFVNRLVE